MSTPGFGFFATGAFPTLLAGIVYRTGAQRRADIAKPASRVRHATFALGLGAFIVSIEWPFAQWAHELFFVHQIGIMIARLISPLLIAIAHPAGLLIAGLTHSFRRKLLRPALSNAAVRHAWNFAAHPAVVVVLYVAALYFWEIPSIQASAVTQPVVGLSMHFSLLLIGLLYWSRVLERRAAPHAATHGARLMMIWIAILSQILLGAYITVKTTILYSAYAVSERIALIPPIVDEERGGFFIWIASSLISLFALILVIDLWGRHETKMDAKRRRWSPSNSAILLYPETGAALREMVRVKNRRLAIGMAGFALLIFSAIFGSAITGHRLNRRENIRQYLLSKS